MLRKQYRHAKLDQDRVRAAVQNLARDLAHFSPAVRKSGAHKADRAKWPRHTAPLGKTAPGTRRAKASVGFDPNGAAFLQSETPSGPSPRATLTNEPCLCRSPPNSPYCRPRAASDARAQIRTGTLPRWAWTSTHRCARPQLSTPLLRPPAPPPLA